MAQAIQEHVMSNEIVWTKDPSESGKVLSENLNYIEFSINYDEYDEAFYVEFLIDGCCWDMISETYCSLYSAKRGAERLLKRFRRM